MAQIGQIAASSSGVVNLDYLPERIALNAGDPVSDARITALTVVTAGRTLAQITGAAYIQAVAAFDMRGLFNDTAVESEPARWLRLALGRVNKQTNITLNNSVASIFPVLAASTGVNDVVRTINEQVLNQSSNATFKDFEMLVIEGNFLRASITFDNGFKDDYEPSEVRALWASEQAAANDGFLDTAATLVGISGRNIKEVTVYANTGASTKIVRTSYETLS